MSERQTRIEIEMHRHAMMLEARVATCHERVACPTCDAPVGVKCRGRGRPVLKSPHVARLRRDGVNLR